MGGRLEQPVPGTLRLGGTERAVVVMPCGQFDLLPHLKQPPKPAGLSGPGDWSRGVREVESGQLTLLVSCRGLELEEEERERFFFGLRGVRLAVKLATWSTWPGPFGRQEAGGGRSARGPSWWQERWGPELVSRLVSTGSYELDLSAFLRGARFAAVSLFAWRLFGDAPKAAFDWLICERGCPRSSPFPVSELVQEVRPEPFSSGPGADLSPWRVSGIGLVLDRPPTVSAVTNTSAAKLTFRPEVLYGTAGEVRDAIEVEPGDSRILLRLGDGEPATGFQLYAHKNGYEGPASFTLTYSGRS